MSTGLTKFGNVGRVSPDIQAYVNSQIATAVQPLVAGVGPSITNGNTIYSDTTGKKVKCAPYTMPTTVGTVGQVLEVDAGGNIVYGAGGGVPPTYLPTLTVSTLSQGPSDLIQNYTFPNYAPLADQVITSSGIYVMDLSGSPQRRAQFALGTNTSGVIDFFIPFSNEASPIEDLLNTMNVEIRRVASAVNCVAEIIIGYNSLTNTFNFTLSPNTTPSNFTFFRWVTADNPTNYNDLFGVQFLLPGPVLQLPSATPTNMPLPAVGVSLSTNCVWRSLANVPFSSIQSESGGSSIQCEDIGIGQNGIISYGNYNINNGSINNCGNINALDNCNITTNTTQIVNGLSELNINIDSLPRITQDAIKTKIECGVSKIQLSAISDGTSEDNTTYMGASNIGNTENTVSIYLPNDYQILQNNGAIQRMVVDNDKSALYSKNATSGPAGSLLELNNDNTFTLGCYFANNGIIECRPNSLALYGNAANSSFTMTGSDITTALSNGSGRIDREVISTASQSFRDPTGTERLKIDSDITINGAYTLPTTAGTTGQVLTRDTGISSTWQTPQLYGLYSQTGTATVANTVVETTLIGSGVGSLSVPANYFIVGMAFRYNTGGTFRDNANNTTFRFRLRNGGVLFDSGLLTLPLITVVSAWNIDVTFSYVGGTTIITNFNFQYNNGSDARGFTSQNTNTTLNTTIPNTLNFTVQWGAASANNTITTNFGVLQKIY